MSERRSTSAASASALHAVVLAAAIVAASTLAACSPRIERSGIERSDIEADSAIELPVGVTDAALGVVTDDPAIEELTVSGLVVIEATDEVQAEQLARVIDLPLAAGDAVEVGDVLAVLQPTSTAVEAFDAATQALAEASAAATGPRGDRPSADTMRALVAARDAAAAALADGDAIVPSEPVELVAGSSGVVVSVLASLGSLVDAGDPIVSVGPVSSVEVHVVVSDALLDLFVGAADQALLLERAEGTAPQPLTIGTPDRRLVRRGDGDSTVRLSFDDPPQVTEGQRVDVVVGIEPDLDARVVPVQALFGFNGTTFVLVADGDRVRRVDVEISRIGAERVEVLGDIELGERVLLR